MTYTILYTTVFISDAHRPPFVLAVTAILCLSVLSMLYFSVENDRHVDVYVSWIIDIFYVMVGLDDRVAFMQPC